MSSAAKVRPLEWGLLIPLLAPHRPSRDTPSWSQRHRFEYVRLSTPSNSTHVHLTRPVQSYTSPD